MTRLQYGTRIPGQTEIRWPDIDGDLTVAMGRSYAETYVSADKPEDVLLAALKDGVTLVRRTLGEVEDIASPLPTTPGAVVRGQYTNGAGFTRGAVLANRGHGTWVATYLVGGYDLVHEADVARITDWTVVYDPTEATS